jgi:L-ascorbate metabolism protein UlaG (beta-lactamase superfamily)
MAQGGAQITWLGHAAFRIRSPRGKVIYVDPWLDNPKCPEGEKSVEQADVVLVTHGHFDHLGNAVDIAKKTSAKVVCNFEISVWLGSQGLESAVGMNKGGTVDLDGIRVTMVHAEHSSGISDGDRIVDGGTAGGFVVELEDGLKLYHAGDTTVFGDMRLIGELYGPELALLPIGGFYTMGPREAATAVRLLGVKRVIPMHYGTFPVLAGTPEELRELLRGHQAEIVVLQPGETR